MAFRFKTKEDFNVGFSRIAAQQIARTLREWQNPDRAVAVHETRKCLKRLRSLLRLAKPVLSRPDYRAENGFLRDIARSLAVSRDVQVMNETIDFLKSEATQQELRHLSSLQHQIENSLPDSQLDAAPNEKKIAKSVRHAGARLAMLEPSAKGFDLVAPGFEKTYRQGRRRMHDLMAEHSDEASHDWRKRVQAHWRQLRLLSAAWPDLIDARIVLARHLAHTLGLDHDLAILQEYAKGPSGEAVGEVGTDAITRLIEKRQQELRMQALNAGRILFADRPKTLSKQVRRYWEIAGEQPMPPPLSSRVR